MMGKVFDIQRFCTGDGPGIRTTVFLKGCPLKCHWCHNPESQKRETEFMFYSDKCVSCGRCAGITEKDTDFVCYEGAKKICGRDMSVDAVLEEVMKDSIFYKNSGGGLTLSGGEPLFQPEFALEILKKAKEKGLNTAVETCGFAKPEAVREIAEYTDIFLFDFKETDPEKHRAFTGVENGIILENLFMLDTMGKDIVLRCPIIPGYNDREDHYEGIARTADGLRHVLRVEIEPCHDLGQHKYAAVGREKHEISPLSAEDAGKIIEVIQHLTKAPVIKA